jgi:uroporphyrinogen decarboxylase
LDTWFRCHLRVIEDLPAVIWFSSWWSEIGMDAEPSALGAWIRFHDHRVPDVEPLRVAIERLQETSPPEAAHDGFVALCLYRYEKLQRRIAEAGCCVPGVAARGPLTIASFVRSVTQLMEDIIDRPEQTLQLLELTTRVGIQWLQAQAQVRGSQVEGIRVLDELAGFIGRRHYLQFAHPFLKRYADAFPAHRGKVFHNDPSVKACLDLLPATGFDVLNGGVALHDRSLPTHLRWYDPHGQRSALGPGPARYPGSQLRRRLAGLGNGRKSPPHSGLRRSHYHRRNSGQYQRYRPRSPRLSPKAREARP